MTHHPILVLVIAAWAAVGAVLTGYTAANTNPDARWIVISVGLVAVIAAGGAAIAARRGNLRASGALLIVSAVTPSGFFYAPNVVALLGGVALVVVAFSRGSGPNARST